MTGCTDAPWSPDPDAETGMRIRFGENVRLLRARAHISQEELASRADVHRTQIALFESGQRMSILGTALKPAAALEVELSTPLDGIVYRPRLFSAARAEFEISSTGLFDRTTGPTAGSAEERDR